MTEAYLLDSVRTPFGRFGGGLAHIRTDDLAALPMAELMARNPGLDPADIDDVIVGATNGAGEDNRNVARMALLLAGLPVTVPGTTVNRLCGSGAEALVQAMRAVGSGEAHTAIAGGVESMSRAPFVVPRPAAAFPRSMDLVATTVGWRLVNPRFPASWVRPLGAVADSLACEYGIDRVRQDEWALRSHQAAAAAWGAGKVGHDVMTVGDVVRDESIRTDTNIEALRGLDPAFASGGTVTAGNSSPINDGAIAALVGTSDSASKLGRPPRGRLLGSAVVGIEPDRFPVAPVTAMRRLAERVGHPLQSFDLFEVNEAFAAMVLCTLMDLPEVDHRKVNVHGGAIAIGHPLGASALRIVADLCDHLRTRGGGRGIAAACIGVGQGIAIACEVQP
jgi:acetyl-CoA acetyltransferase family protein